MFFLVLGVWHAWGVAGVAWGDACIDCLDCLGILDSCYLGDVPLMI